MDTQTFLQGLEPHTTSGLVFELPDGGLVAPGYHVTEVIAASFRSVDCGGRSHAWGQTLVQLQGPSQRDAPEFMRVGKFLAIYARAAASLPVGDADELRLEYGDAERPAIHYGVAGLEESEGALRVRLLAPGVSCKPRAEAESAPPNELPRLACC